MTETMFYIKISTALIDVKTVISGISHEHVPIDRDYMCASIKAYRNMNLNLYPAEVSTGSIIWAIDSMAKSTVIDPMVVATLAVCYMRQAWEHYQKIRDPPNGW